MISGAASAAAPRGTTIDAFLGGRVEVPQPSQGHHRSGLEAVLLAASLDARISGTVIDLGAGAGAAGLCAAARCRQAKVVLVERDAEAVACAKAALARPANAGLADRVRVVPVDITLPEAERARAGIGRGLADHVILNPPFYSASAASASPRSARAKAHILDRGGLDSWLRAAASVLKFGGDLTVIFRADGLETLLGTLVHRFGGVDILPIHPRPISPASRILVRALKGSRAFSRILPSLTLHGETGNGFKPEIEAILRHGKPLTSASRAWHSARGRPSSSDAG